MTEYNNIKIPATKAGIEMIEQATYYGISVTETVSFTLPQVVAAEAVERGLKRRQAGGGDISTMSQIVVIIVWRTDERMKALVIAQSQKSKPHP